MNAEPVATGQRKSIVEARRLAFNGMALAGVTLLLSLATGAYAYYVGYQNYFTHVRAESLLVARQLADHMDELGRLRPTGELLAVLEHSASHWNESTPGGYVCAIGKDGKLLIHTGHPAHVGRSIDAQPIGSTAGAEGTIGDLLREHRDWSGYYTALDGQQQLVAFAYSRALDGLVSTHIPSGRIGQEYRQTGWPWLVAGGAILAIFLPAAMLLFWSAHRSIVWGLVDTQDDLRRSTAQYQLLAEALPQFVWTAGRDERADYVSTYWMQYTGMTLEESRNDGWRRAVHPDDAPALLRGWRSAKQSRAPHAVEFRVQRGSDGHYRWFRGTIRPLIDANGEIEGHIGTGADIHDLKATAEALRISEQHFRLLADNTTDVIMRSLPDGTIVYVSPAVRSLTGYQPGEVAGRSVYGFLHADDNQVVQKAHIDLAMPSLADPTVRFRIRHRNGEYLWVEASGKPVWKSGTQELAEVVAVLRDITARRKLEDDLHAAAQRLSAVLHSSPLAMLAFGPGENIGGNVTLWNPAAERIFGWTHDDIRSAGHLPWVPADRMHEVERMRFSAESTGKPVIGFQTRRLHKDGRLIDVILHVAPILDASGVPVGATIIVQLPPVDSQA